MGSRLKPKSRRLLSIRTLLLHSRGLEGRFSAALLFLSAPVFIFALARRRRRRTSYAFAKVQFGMGATPGLVGKDEASEFTMSCANFLKLRRFVTVPETSR